MKRFLLFVAMLSVSLCVAAQNPKKVALLETLNGDKRVPLKGIEMNMVRGELRKAISGQSGYKAFTRTDIDQLMKEHGFQNSGLVADSQRKRLGEMSGADYICVSVLTKSSTQFYLEAYLIDVETGEITNPATQYGMLLDGSYSNLFQLCQDLAKELVESVGDSGGGSYIRTIKVGNVNLELVKVEAGSFVMGCTSEQGGECFDREKPSHRVTITHDYYIGQFEVTQELYEAVMGVNPSIRKTYNRPVEYVSWDDAQEFCAKLSRMTGYSFSLPTEAEWEYAARGGKKSAGTKYSGSSSATNVAWCEDNSGGATHTVGSLLPNELGIYDMSGNVWEWCQDWGGDYSSTNQTDPTGPSSGSDRVNRGGSFSDGNAARTRSCRVTSRSYSNPGARYSNLGFRVVLH